MPVTYQRKLTTHQPLVEPIYVRKVTNETFPPPPLSKKELVNVVSQFCNAISPDNFEEVGCMVCGMLTPKKSAIPKNEVKFNWNLLNNVTGRVTKIECATFEDSDLYSGPVVDNKCSHVCTDCNELLLKKKIPLLSLCNGNWLGDIPVELQGLSYAEKLLIARIRTNYCMMRVESGMKKLHANAVLIPNPVPKIYHKLPPHQDEIDQVLAFIYTGPLPPTKEDLKRTPFIVHRQKVTAMLQWLKLNHCDYTDIEISDENASSYEEGEPPVTIEYHKRNTNKYPLATGLDDIEGDEMGTASDDCPFVVHGLTSDNIDIYNKDKLVAQAIEHMELGGKSLGIGTSNKLASLYNNPQLYPKAFPWLFPYGFGGIGNEQGFMKVPEHHRKCQLLMYHDKHFQNDSSFVLMAFNHGQIKTATTGGFLLTKKSNFNDIAEQLLTVDHKILLALAVDYKWESM